MSKTLLAQGTSYHDGPITCSNHYRRDTFTGAYASKYVQQKSVGEWNIRKAVIRVNKGAATTMKSVGAQNGIPWSDEIEKFEGTEMSPRAIRSHSTAFLGSNE